MKFITKLFLKMIFPNDRSDPEKLYHRASQFVKTNFVVILHKKYIPYFNKKFLFFVDK